MRLVPANQDKKALTEKALMKNKTLLSFLIRDMSVPMHLLQGQSKKYILKLTQLQGYQLI